MRQPRKVVSAALFNLLKSCYPFKISRQKGFTIGQVSAADQPALTLIKISEDDSQQQTRYATRYTLNYLIIVYAQVDPSPLGVPEAILDDILDAIDNAINGPNKTGARQDLGLPGIENCWIEGHIDIVGGIEDQQAAMLIPVKVTTGL